MEEVRALLERHSHIECEVRHWRDPNFTDPQPPPAPDEYVEAEDLVTVAKPYALAMATLFA